MRKIKVRYVCESHEHSENISWEQEDTAFVTMDNGEEFEVDVTWTHDEMYRKILAKLGYELEETVVHG